MRRQRGIAALGAFVALAGTIAVVVTDVPPASASTIVVNTLEDVPPVAGVFPTDAKCSLRAAITTAVANTNAADVDCAAGAPTPNVLDVIRIADTLTGTMTLTWNNGSGVQPFPLITGPTQPIEILGPTLDAGDFTIDGGDDVRPFTAGLLDDALSAANLTLSNLTVTGGNGQDNGGSPFATDNDGGAMYLGAATKLTLNNVEFVDNHTTGTNGRGGAIYANRPIITNNGGSYIDNSAAGTGINGRGGAIFIENGPATFNGYAMLLQGNSANWFGGAIATNPGANSALVHIERSLIRNNSTTGVGSAGGVLYIDSSVAGEVFELADSTVTGNSSVFYAQSSLQRFRYLRTTFVDTNELYRAGGGYIANSIITGENTCIQTATIANFSGVNNRVAPIPPLVPGDPLPPPRCGLNGYEPLGEVTNLSPTLAQNGGPEVQQTFALLPGSNAIDQGDVAECGTIDARTVERGLDGDGTVDSPEVGDCDIGAYEYAAFVVNFAADTFSADEDDGSVNITAIIKILNPAVTTLPAAVFVPIGITDATTATPGFDFTVVGGGITFPAGTPSGGTVPLVVTLVDDDVAELIGEEVFLAMQPGGTAGVAFAAPSVARLVIADDDMAGVVVNDGGGTTVAEATPAIGEDIQVRLQSRPDRELQDPTRPFDPDSYGPPADVEMTVTPDRDCTVTSGTTVGTSASPLVFTILNDDWDVDHPLTIKAVNDLYDEDLRDETVTHTCELRYTFDSADPLYDVTEDAYEADIIDNDVAGVILQQVSGPPILAEGSADTVTYSVRLTTPPDPGKPIPGSPRAATQVVFTPTPGCSVNGSQNPVARTFTEANFATTQPVLVTATDDFIVQLLHTCTVITSIASGDPIIANLDDPPPFAGTPPNISADVQDYDPPGITNDPPFVDITTGGISVSEATPGTADTFSVVLRRAPAVGTVTVTFNASDDPVIGPQVTLKPAASGVAGPTATLTFNGANWNVPQLVEVRAVDDDFDETDPHAFAFSASMASAAPGFSSQTLRRIVVDGSELTNPGIVPVSIGDDDTSEVLAITDPVTSAVAEGGADGTLLVGLATHPYADVDVTVTPDAQCTVDGAASTTVTIVAAQWATPVEVSLEAVDDDLVETNPHPCQLSLVASSSDTLYDTLTDDATIDVTDNEIAEALITTGDGLAVSETGPTSDSFSVVLSGKPSADVTVTIASDAQVTAPSSVTFTSLTWATPQSVSVAAVDDDLDEASPHNGTLTFGISSTAPGYASGATVRVDGTATTTANVAVTDDDAAGITLAGTLELAEGGAADTYTLVLDSEPTDPVSIAMSATGLCSIDASSVTFTAADWDDPQTVTVTPGEDDIDHAQTCDIDHAAATSADGGYSGLPVADLTVAVTDDDTAGVSITAGPLALHEALAGTASYTVVLDTEPTDDVTVTIGTADGQTTADQPSLTFTNATWDTAQTVVVSVVDDTTVEISPHTGTLSHSSSSADLAYGASVAFGVDGAAGSTVSVAITDDDTTTSITIEPASPSNAGTTSATATVAGGEAPRTGTVTFTLDGTPLAPIALAADAATVDLGVLSTGDHPLDAAYSGDALHEASSASRTIHVTALPVAADDPDATIEEDGGPLAIDVLANDTDVDGDTLTVADGSWTQGAHGTVSCTTTGCTYTPEPDFNGTDTFTYEATDGALSDGATVTVTVTPVNDAPSLGTVTVEVIAGGTITFDVLADATDVDGDPLTVSDYTQPAHGTVACDPDGVCTYTPDEGYTGPDSFTYTVSDGAAELRTAAVGSAAVVEGTVQITVTAAAPPGGTDGGTSGGGDGLPATGLELQPLLTLAGVLLTLGGALSLRRRRPAYAPAHRRRD